ncbi:MAG TPA: PH domain-containing protein [Candidatus Binatia bacterium]|nr:PH domain-containing protein [Candidatus Binatia bacterium]
MDLVFRSKIDIWLVGLIVAIPVLVLEFLFEGTGPAERTIDLIATVFVVIVLAFILWLYLTTRYTITADTLWVKSGPFSWVILLEEIYTIESTRNPASSPALSLDRLLIRYGGGSEIMVSPADKAGFMAAIKKRTKRPVT